ncbi:MAG: NADH-quinone oxidoreductase subunit J [Bacteroidota bacterium]
MTLYIFYFLSFVAIFSALLVVFSKNPVYSVLYLIITFVAIGFHFLLLLNAEFLFAVHIIVYAGAIMVLFLYVIMMLNLNTETEPHKTGFLRLSATICAVLFVVIFIGSLKGADTMIAATTSDPGAIGVVKNLGKILFTDFLLHLKLFPCYCYPPWSGP